VLRDRRARQRDIAELLVLIGKFRGFELFVRARAGQALREPVPLFRKLDPAIAEPVEDSAA